MITYWIGLVAYSFPDVYGHLCRRLNLSTTLMLFSNMLTSEISSDRPPERRDTWVLVIPLFVVLVLVFLLGPESLPLYKHQILRIVCALLCGFAAFFLTGELGVVVNLPATRFGKMGVKTGGGVGMFFLVLFWFSSPPLPSAASTPPLKSFLYGSWETRNYELGKEVHIVWKINDDGTTNYVAHVDGETVELASEWTYANGFIYEDSGPGTAASKIDKIDPDSFKLTIVVDETSSPESRTVSRIYRRVSSNPEDLLGHAHLIDNFEIF